MHIARLTIVVATFWNLIVRFSFFSLTPGRMSRATWNWNDPIAAPLDAVAVRTSSLLLAVEAASKVDGFFSVVPMTRSAVRWLIKQGNHGSGSRWSRQCPSYAKTTLRYTDSTPLGNRINV